MRVGFACLVSTACHSVLAYSPLPHFYFHPRLACRLARMPLSDVPPRQSAESTFEALSANRLLLFLQRQASPRPTPSFPHHLTLCKASFAVLIRSPFSFLRDPPNCSSPVFFLNPATLNVALLLPPFAHRSFYQHLICALPSTSAAPRSHSYSQVCQRPQLLKSVLIPNPPCISKFPCSSSSRSLLSPMRISHP